MVALEHHPAGNVDDVLGLGAGLEGAELVAEAAQGVVARVRDRVGVDAALAEGLDLGEPVATLLRGAPVSPVRDAGGSAGVAPSGIRDASQGVSGRRAPYPRPRTAGKPMHGRP